MRNLSNKKDWTLKTKNVETVDFIISYGKNEIIQKKNELLYKKIILIPRLTVLLNPGTLWSAERLRYMSRSSSLSPSSLNLSYLALFCSSTLDPYLCFRFSAAEAVLSTICLKLSRVATSRFWRLLEFLIFVPIIPRLWRAPPLELSWNPCGDWLKPDPGTG